MLFPGEGSKLAGNFMPPVNALVTEIARDDSSAYMGDICALAQFRATPLLVLTILRRRRALITRRRALLAARPL